MEVPCRSYSCWTCSCGGEANTHLHCHHLQDKAWAQASVYVYVGVQAPVYAHACKNVPWTPNSWINRGARPNCFEEVSSHHKTEHRWLIYTNLHSTHSTSLGLLLPSCSSLLLWSYCYVTGIITDIHLHFTELTTNLGEEEVTLPAVLSKRIHRGIWVV